MPSDPAKVEPSPREELLAEVRSWAQTSHGDLQDAYRALEVLALQECPHGCSRDRWCDTDLQARAAGALAVLRGSR
jgi:hypothetical protein